MADLVANELPVSTESVMEEAEEAGEKLRRWIFLVDNLEGLHFLDSKVSYFAFFATYTRREYIKRIGQDQLSSVSV